MAQILKTCNGCLPRNWRPALMGVNAKVKYCRCCKMRSAWSEADPNFITEWNARRARTESLIEELLRESE